MSLGSNGLPEGKAAGRYLQPPNGPLSPEDNSELYKQLYEKKGGEYRDLKAEIITDLEAKDFKLDPIPATEVASNPVSLALLKAFNGKVNDSKALMYLALHHLKNGEENKLEGDTSNSAKKDINFVETSDKITVYKDENQRWKLKVLDANDHVRLDGFIIPKEPVKAVVVEEDKEDKEVEEKAKEDIIKAPESNELTPEEVATQKGTAIALWGILEGLDNRTDDKYRTTEQIDADYTIFTAQDPKGFDLYLAQLKARISEYGWEGATLSISKDGLTATYGKRNAEGGLKGYGIKALADGRLWGGEYSEREGEFEGYGIWIGSKKDSSYAGEWMNNKREGFGKETNENGTLYGKYKEGRLVVGYFRPWEGELQSKPYRLKGDDKYEVIENYDNSEGDQEIIVAQAEKAAEAAGNIVNQRQSREEAMEAKYQKAIDEIAKYYRDNHTVESEFAAEPFYKNEVGGISFHDNGGIFGVDGSVNYIEKIPREKSGNQDQIILDLNKAYTALDSQESTDNSNREITEIKTNLVKSLKTDLPPATVASNQSRLQGILGKVKAAIPASNPQEFKVFVTDTWPEEEATVKEIGGVQYMVIVLDRTDEEILSDISGSLPVKEDTPAAKEETAKPTPLAVTESEAPVLPQSEIKSLRSTLYGFEALGYKSEMLEIFAKIQAEIPSATKDKAMVYLTKGWTHPLAAATINDEVYAVIDKDKSVEVNAAEIVKAMKALGLDK